MRIRTLVLWGCQCILPVLAQLDINSKGNFQLSKDAEFGFVLETILSLSNNRGASTAEVLRAASQITPGDFESWYKELLHLGDAIHAQASNINASRFPVSAREAYFRSSTYYRHAPFFLHQNASDPRINDIGSRAIEDFNRAAALLSIPAVNIKLPARSSNVPGRKFFVPARFFKAQGGNAKAPTIIIGTGYDGTQEDLYHGFGLEILERGWNVITYEGPGQPTVLAEQQLGFIPDWWNVVSPIVDYLETRKDVDTDHIALVGVSFGGSLAPIAASREHRLAAVLAIDGISSLSTIFSTQLKASHILELYDAGRYAEFDKYLLGAERNTSMPTSLRWAVAQSLFSFNTTSPSDWWGRLSNFTVTDAMLVNISCPAFIGEGENDSSKGQAAHMVKAIGPKATYNLFRTDVGAGEHCQIGAEAQLAQVTWDWLADTWDHVTLPKNLTDKIV